MGPGVEAREVTGSAGAEKVELGGKESLVARQTNQQRRAKSGLVRRREAR